MNFQLVWFTHGDTKLNMNNVKLLGLLSILVFFFGCEELPSESVVDNPLDPDNPNYEAPLATIDSGGGDGDILLTNSVSFIWSGKNELSQFAYKLEDFDSDWSDWSSNLEVAYNYLDEGDYIFNVKEKYSTGDEQETPTAISFTVNAIAGPAFVMKRQLVEINNNNAFAVDVIAEEVDNLLAALIKIEFDTDKLDVLSIDTAGTSNWSANTDGITFVATSVTDANTNGWMEINTTRLGGEPVGMTGTGTVATITFTARNTGVTNITFSAGNTCQMRDSNNTNLDINELVLVRVEIN